MYIVEVKANRFTCEREFIRKCNAVKAASRAASDGFIMLDGAMELNHTQKRIAVQSVRVYDSENPDIDIDF